MLHLVKVESEGVSNWIVSDALRPNGLYSPRNSPGQNNGVDNLSLLQGIIPTQGLNPALPHCRWFLYQLSHQGSPFEDRVLFNSCFPGSERSAGKGIGYLLQYSWDSLVAQLVKKPPAMQETWVWSLGWEDPLEESMATHSSILVRRIPVDRGAWQTRVHGVTKSWTWLSD